MQSIIHKVIHVISLLSLHKIWCEKLKMKLCFYESMRLVHVAKTFNVTNVTSISDYIIILRHEWGWGMLQTFICKYCWACRSSMVFCSIIPIYCRMFLLETRSSLPNISWMTDESHWMLRNSWSTPLRSSSSTLFTSTFFFWVASFWRRILSLFS